MAASDQQSSVFTGKSASTGTLIRAEFPPAQYWRRWTGDAAPAVISTDDVMALEQPAPTPAKPSASSGVSQSSTDSVNAPYRVLIVEDDPSQALFAEAVLRSSDIETRVVLVASEVLLAAREFNPDLILTDLHMPGLNGAEITAMIREQSALSHIPIVFVTGDDDPERQYEALRVGADDFLAKPVQPRQLIATVTARAQRSRALKQQTPVTPAIPIEQDLAASLGSTKQQTLLSRNEILQQLNSSIPGLNNGSVALILIHGNQLPAEEFKAVGARIADAFEELPTNHFISQLNDHLYLLFSKDIENQNIHPWMLQLQQNLLQQQHDETDSARRVGIYIGYTTLDHHFSNSGAALTATEQALRIAKTRNNGVNAYSSVQNKLNTNNYAPLIDALKGALSKNQVALEYHPITSVNAESDTQYKTVVKAYLPDGKVLSAKQIIDIAHAGGFTHEIDKRAMLLAINTLRAPLPGKQKPSRLFVPQSVSTILKSGYDKWFQAIKQQLNIDDDVLVLTLRQDDALNAYDQLTELIQKAATRFVFCLYGYDASPNADIMFEKLPIRYACLSDTSSFGRPAWLHEGIERAHDFDAFVIGPEINSPDDAALLWISGIDYIQEKSVDIQSQILESDSLHSLF